MRPEGCGEGAGLDFEMERQRERLTAEGRKEGLRILRPGPKWPRVFTSILSAQTLH